MSGHVDYDREAGRCAYEAYRQALQFRSPSGEIQPEWDDLPTEIEEIWIAVARAVREHEKDRVTQF